MKLSMGKDYKSPEKVGTRESHYGFVFRVQKDKTVITEDITDRELLKVAKIEIEHGRLIEAKTAQQEAEEAAILAEAAAKKAADAAKQAAVDANAAADAITEPKAKRGRPKKEDA